MTAHNEVIRQLVKVSGVKTNTGSALRIVIPKQMAKDMGVTVGDQILLEYWGGEIRMKKF